MKDAQPEKTRRGRLSDRPGGSPAAEGEGPTLFGDAQLPQTSTARPLINGRSGRSTGEQVAEPEGDGLDAPAGPGPVLDLGATIPGVAGLPLVQQPVPTPAEAARSFRARRRLWLRAGLLI